MLYLIIGVKNLYPETTKKGDSAMKEGNWVVFKAKHPSPRNGEVAEVKEVISLGDRIGVGLQFIRDDFQMAAHPEECESVVEWQGV